MAKQLPIPFSGPMVRAIFDKRKTMTRRVLDIVMLPGVNPNFSQLVAHKEHDNIWRIYGSEPASKPFKPRYQVGDMLYVREAWRTWSFNDKKPPRELEESRLSILYEATPNQLTKNGPLISECGKFRQGMHMPKWASRLTLEVTGVKVERLKDISHSDAIAEGTATSIISQFKGGTPIKRFEQLWDSINATRKGGIYAWERNPWVAAYTFDPIFKNVSEVE
ncbi:MAG: hypothetical protein GY941_27335 [Planctomycetes bacterium]|nr:hypothetical protein [Planctomycetota bacterium]